MQGINFYPDEGPRDTPLHKKITGVTKIPNTRSGHYLDLECGHQVMSFGSLAHADGVILCDQCRSKNQDEQ
jgi:hypothetical protein